MPILTLGGHDIVVRAASGAMVLGFLPVVPMTFISGLLMVVVSRADRAAPGRATRRWPGIRFHPHPQGPIRERHLPAPFSPMTPTQWLICAIAALGFAFDTYELLMLPLIARPALADLLNVAPSDPLVNEWVGILFYVPAVAGGIFGLIGGYLTDIFGRRRVLVWSILIYAFSALAAGFATSPQWLLFWRCGIFVGVCVEFVAAVAWLSELFPEPERRERVVGYTQAFGSFGGLMVTGAYYLMVTYGESLPAVHGGHEAWRYTLMSGVIPAHSAHAHSAVPARVAHLAPEETGRHAATTELRRALHAGVPAHDDRHDDHDGVRVRRRVRRDSAGAAHRARTGGRARARPRRRRSRPSAPCRPFRRSAVSWAASRSVSSRHESSAGAGCSTRSRCRG